MRKRGGKTAPFTRVNPLRGNPRTYVRGGIANSPLRGPSSALMNRLRFVRTGAPGPAMGRSHGRKSVELQSSCAHSFSLGSFQIQGFISGRTGRKGSYSIFRGLSLFPLEEGRYSPGGSFLSSRRKAFILSSEEGGFFIYPPFAKGGTKGESGPGIGIRADILPEEGFYSPGGRRLLYLFPPL